ncbi:uncharacterized protein LOC144148366 [Haemaphysalis longicornis]
MYPRDRAPPPPSLCKPEAPYLSPSPTRRGPAAAAGPNGCQTPWYRLGARRLPRGAPAGAASRPRRGDRRASTARPILRAACAEQAEPSSPDDGQDHHEVF